jgi:hypothetical protein
MDSCTFYTSIQHSNNSGKYESSYFHGDKRFIIIYNYDTAQSGARLPRYLRSVIKSAYNGSCSVKTLLHPSQFQPVYTSVRHSQLVTKSRASSFLDPRPLKMGPTGCPETSVRNYHYSLRNSPQEGGYLLYLRYYSKTRHAESTSTS